MEFFDASTDLSGSGSEQGQLSSSYTAALTEYLQTDGADYVAFLAHVVNNLSIEDALLVKAEIEAGNFTLSGLFSAAQSKTGEVDGDTMTNPTPTLTVGDLVIVLTPMLTGTETFTWDTTTKKTVTYHTREFYTEGQEPADYTAGWAESNHAPEVSGPVAQTIDEDDAVATIDLLANATDSDGDDMDLGGSITYGVTAGTWDADIAFNVDPETGELSIDPAQFNSLGETETIEITFSYNVIDGKGGVTPATAVITITGSNDAATITASANEDTSAKEDVDYTAGGQLTVSDDDRGETVFSTVDASDLDGTYGDFTFNEATGEWTYTLNNADQVVQDLKFYQTVQDSLTVESLDGTDSEIITVSIQGTADQYTLTTSISTTKTMVSTTSDSGLEDTFDVSLQGLVDSQAYDFEGTATVKVTGDINDPNETALVTLEGGDEDTFNQSYTGEYFNGAEKNNTDDLPNNNEDTRSYTSDTNTIEFTSTDSSVQVTYDTEGAVKVGTIEVTITEFQYWV